MKPYCILYTLASALALSSCSSVQEGSSLVVLPQDPITMVVHQRSGVTIPGSGKGIEIRIGDITGGQTMLSVIATGKDFLVEPRSVRVGDVLQIPTGKEPLYLKVARFRNFLIGDDFREFIISKSPFDSGEKLSIDGQSGSAQEVKEISYD